MLDLDNRELSNFIEKAKKYNNIISVILFGSYAKAKQRENSDIDICIIRNLSKNYSDFDYLLNLSEIFDITFLDQLPFIMQNRVFKEGKFLVNNNSFLLKIIRKKIQSEYRDSYYIREKYNKKLLYFIYGFIYYF